MPLEIDYYDLSVHKLMLRDQVRCEAFRKAIAETITPGCAVLDVGAGTGILSVFAAQAGARVVYGVERTDTAEIARRIVLENGFEDKIKIFQSDMESTEIPGKVDVIVSEWLGGYGIDENLLPVVILARDRWLKSGGKMIPTKVASWIAPAYDDLLQQDVGAQGVKFSGHGLLGVERDVLDGHDCRNTQQDCEEAGRQLILPLEYLTPHKCSELHAAVSFGYLEALLPRAGPPCPSCVANVV